MSKSTKHVQHLASICKMLVYALLVCLALTACKAEDSIFPDHEYLDFMLRDVNDDLDDFINAMPLKQMAAILNTYRNTDEEVKKDYEYFHSAEFQQKLLALEQIPEIQTITAILKKNYVDVQKYVNILHKFLGIPVSRNLMAISQGKGLAGLLDEIKAQLPMATWKWMAVNKYIFKWQFRYLVQELQSEDFKLIVKSVTASEKVKEFVADLKANGVDVKAIQNFVKSLS